MYLNQRIPYKLGVTMTENSISFPFNDIPPHDESLDEDICPNCNGSFLDHTNDQIIQCAQKVLSESI